MWKMVAPFFRMRTNAAAEEAGAPGATSAPPVAETSEEGYQAGESDAWAGMFRCGR